MTNFKHFFFIKNKTDNDLYFSIIVTMNNFLENLNNF